MMDAANKHNTQINHRTWDFNVVRPQDGSYVHRTVLLYYSLREGKHNSVAPHMQLKIFSLISFFSSLGCRSYNILFPLSRSLWIVTCILYKPATGFSKIATAKNRTRAHILQQSTYPYCLFQSRLSNYLTNPLQCKITSFYKQPEGLAFTTLWAYPNSNPNPNQ